MLKIKEFLCNEYVLSILAFLIMLLIIFAIMFVTSSFDRKRCEKNGGKYIWEFSYGNKCHLVEKVGEINETN